MGTGIALLYTTTKAIAEMTIPMSFVLRHLVPRVNAVHTRKPYVP